MRRQTTIRSKQERPSHERALSRRVAGGGSGLSEREFGRLEEKAHQTEVRLNRLEDQVYERKRRRQALALSWWQVLIAGLFVLGASFGSALLVLFLGP